VLANVQLTLCGGVKREDAVVPLREDTAVGLFLLKTVLKDQSSGYGFNQVSGSGSVFVLDVLKELKVSFVTWTSFMEV
jgi:hypothetical protein